jgi:hypothetical protein
LRLPRTHSFYSTHSKTNGVIIIYSEFVTIHSSGPKTCSPTAAFFHKRNLLDHSYYSSTAAIYSAG